MENEKACLVLEKHLYINPSKMVKNIGDMQTWEQSEAYQEYLGFICNLNDAVRGKTNAEGSANASEEIIKVYELLNLLHSWIDEIPPIKQPQRFGNQAFRQWCNRLNKECAKILKELLPQDLHEAIYEISIYLMEGFGNSTRIDYGTGHELSFLMFLCALFKIGFLKADDLSATACKVFVRYLEVVRELQMVYNMEPAGSHGVWSLDDYQFVPFIWGSSQFNGNILFPPTCFLKDNIVKKHASQYMFLSCIQYINMVKTGPFAEHSNQLWGISGVSTWSKINSGLIKMYKAEVLAKFPLVQHIYFGSIFTLKQFQPPKVERPKTSFQAMVKPPQHFDDCHKQSPTSSVDSVVVNSGTDSDKSGVSKKVNLASEAGKEKISYNLTYRSNDDTYRSDFIDNKTSNDDNRRSSILTQMSEDPDSSPSIPKNKTLVSNNEESEKHHPTTSLESSNGGVSKPEVTLNQKNSGK